MKIYEVSPKVEPSAGSYRTLLAEGFARGARFGLVIRDGSASSSKGAALVKSLRTLAGTREHRSATWPGTLLVDGEATVLTGPVSAGALQLLLEGATRLYDWRAPALPEDPFVLREDGSIWLATVSRQGTCFVRGPLEELRRLGTHLDDLAWSTPTEVKGAAS